MPWDGPTNIKWLRDFEGSGKVVEDTNMENKKVLQQHCFLSPAGKTSETRRFFYCCLDFMCLSFTKIGQRESITTRLQNGPSIWIAGPCFIQNEHAPKGNPVTVMRICHGILYRPSREGVFVDSVASYSPILQSKLNLYPWKLDFLEKDDVELGYVLKHYKDDDKLRHSRFSVLTMGLIQQIQMKQHMEINIYLQCGADDHATITWIVYGFTMSLIHITVDGETNPYFPSCPFAVDALPPPLGNSANLGLLVYTTGEQEPLMRMFLMDKNIYKHNPPGHLYNQRHLRNRGDVPPIHFQCGTEFIQWGLHDTLQEFLFQIPFPLPRDDFNSTKKGGVIESIGFHNIDTYEMFRTQVVVLEGAPERLEREHEKCSNDMSTLSNPDLTERLGSLGNVYANEYAFSYLLNPKGKVVTLDLGQGQLTQYTDNPINLRCWHVSVLFLFYGAKHRNWDYRDLRNYLTSLVLKFGRLAPCATGIYHHYSEDIARFINFMLTGQEHQSPEGFGYPSFDGRLFLYPEVAFSMFRQHREKQEETIRRWTREVFFPSQPTSYSTFCLLNYAMQNGRGGFMGQGGKRVSLSMMEATRRRYCWEFPSKADFNEYREMRFKYWRESRNVEEAERMISAFNRQASFKHSNRDSKRFVWRIVHSHGPDFKEVLKEKQATLNFAIARVDGKHFVPIVPGGKFEEYLEATRFHPK
eukprot:scaffold14755_cov157-Amphora_coffeaeformis.AAC.4